MVFEPSQPIVKLIFPKVYSLCWLLLRLMFDFVSFTAQTDYSGAQ